MDRQTIADYLDDLAAGTADPGGGVAAAISAGTGAALLAMACRLTLDRPRFAAHQQIVGDTLAAAERLRAQALSLAADDLAAYGAVMAAYLLPRAGQDQRATRADAVQAALRQATAVPLQLVDLAAEIIEHCVVARPIVNPNAGSDLGVGVLAARAALEGAALSASTNLASIDDRDFVATSSERLQLSLAAALPRAEETLRLLHAPTVR